MSDQTNVGISLVDFIEEARRLLPLMQDPVWAATNEQSDADHLSDYAHTLAKTREHFTDMPENTVMNMVIGDGNVIFALVGNSPESADRARAIVGFLRSMPTLLDQLELSLSAPEAT
jgi:hypothetical protein